MASIMVNNLEDEVMTRLRLRAVAHGRSMEEEVRVILREAVEADAGPDNLAQAIRARFAPSVVSAEQELPSRRPVQGRLKLD